MRHFVIWAFLWEVSLPLGKRELWMCLVCPLDQSYKTESAGGRVCFTHYAPGNENWIQETFWVCGLCTWWMRWLRPFQKVPAAKSLQSCPTRCNPIDGSPPGSPIPGIFQARTLEWVAISFSNAWKWKVKVKSLSRAWLIATPWTAAYQAPPSMGFSKQEYWSRVPSLSPKRYQRKHQIVTL